MDKLQEKLVFIDEDSENNFKCNYNSYMQNLQSMLLDKHNFSLDKFLKSFVECVWSLEKYCHSIAQYPVESVFRPNHDVYRVIGLHILKTLINDNKKIEEFINYGLEKNIIRLRFANLMLSNLHTENGNLKAALACAQKAHADYAHCGASYRTHYECWNACREAGLEVSETFHTLEELKHKFCQYPFEYLVVRNDGKHINIAPCQTSLWMSYAKTYQLEDFLSNERYPDFWNSKEFQEIRKSIHNGDFSYCSKLRCAQLNSLPDKDEVSNEYLRKIINTKQTVLGERPKVLVCSYDETCNLTCPSCRKQVIITPKDIKEKYDQMADKFLLPLIDSKTKFILLNASGEALASPHSIRFLKSIDFIKYPNLKINLMTNGELLKSRLDYIGDSANHIGRLLISFDGFTPETYEMIRRGGNFQRFMEGVNFAVEMKKTGKIDELFAVSTIFEANFRELPAIYEFCENNCFDHLSISKFQNWGSYTADEFLKMDIWNSDHQLYQEWKNIFNELKHRPKKGKFRFTASNNI